MTPRDGAEETSAEDLEFERLLLSSLGAELSPDDAARLDALAAATPARAAKLEGWLRTWTLAGLLDPAAE